MGELRFCDVHGFTVLYGASIYQKIGVHKILQAAVCMHASLRQGRDWGFRKKKIGSSGGTMPRLFFHIFMVSFILDAGTF